MGASKNQTEPVRRLRFVFPFVCVLLVALIIGWRFARLPVPVPSPRPPYLRPKGMAPVAFAAFLQACSAAKVHPFRISQTLGDNPRSKGYHLRDGTIKGENYSAALDMGVDDLTPHKREELLEALARSGFAAWFRTGPKWVGANHVHAVYAGLPMKPQLQAQVRLWNSERRRSGRKTLKWQTKWRRFWR